MFKWSWNSFIQHLTIICYLSMGKIVFKYCKFQHFVYTCGVILTCVIHVFGKDATCIQSFYGFFYRCFCMFVDFYLLSFRHLNAGPMTLPTDDMWQCHPYVGQHMMVDTEVISIPNYTFNFNLLGVIFYTSVF